MSKKDLIIKLLNEGLHPTYLEVIDESHHHKSHSSIQEGSTETHFTIVIMADVFKNLNRLKIHRLVYDTLGAITKEVHSISLKIGGCA